MPRLEREEGRPEPDPEHAAELTWLKENLRLLWPTAYFGYGEQGRGAVVIDAAAEPLQDEAPCEYAAQARIEEPEAGLPRSLCRLVANYDPQREFVALIIRPPEAEFELSIYQLRVAEILVELVRDDGEGAAKLQPAAGDPGA